VFPIVLSCEEDVTVVVVAVFEDVDDDEVPGVVPTADPTVVVGLVVTTDLIALESILSNNNRFYIYRQKRSVFKESSR
jgi:hypothetical protein